MIYIGMDDTDNAEGGGTGRVGRTVAAALRTDGWHVLGVSRHQLLVDPRIPYTSNNSSNVIHLDARPDGAALAALFTRAAALLAPLCLPGSDPGLCVAVPAVSTSPFGRAAQTSVLSQEEAQAHAAELGVTLRPLGGTGDGVVGALAGCILAAGGGDGRFVDRNRIRDLGGILSVAELLAAGVDSVQAAGGEPQPADRVDTLGGRVRPVLQEGRAVLLVERVAGGPAGCDWRVVEQGKPKGGRRREHGC